MRATMLLVAAAILVGCGDHPATTNDMDLGGAGGDMTKLVNGCPPLTSPLTTPDGGAGGDTWASFAQGFFASYCTRCHSSTLTGAARNGAPDGYDWDLESAVRSHLDVIRSAVGVGNFMPPSAPTPTCTERQRIVRWIDAGAP
jgi:cytochrome c5